MSEHYDFHYQPTGSGAISGQQVLEQTEDAINELGDYVNDNVGGAMDVAQQALETAQNAEQDAQTALDTANSFSSAIQSAQQDASTALSTAQTAQTTASNANNTAIQASQDASSAVTTANNASGQVSTLSGTVTALGQRVTTAEGNIGQNTSDITVLTTRVGTAEGNITTLQNDVTIAQGNASSAMATAGQVKQQAFVFRYSSTALTASSTNSNTLLDNTDNLKVGDKVIDSSGVLFSITAIDTQNSTFTVGTALIDLAQDSDVVHKSGDETVGGVKTFSGNPVIGNNNTNITISNRQITANGSYSAPTGSSYSFMQLKAIVNYADSSPSIDATVGLSIQENAYSDGKRAGFNPNSNNTINLGLAGKRWANVYATNYYYGSSETEFSDKFVTTDTAQTISGNKTFGSDLYVANTDTTANTPNLTLRNYKVDRGTTDTGVQTIQFLDKNGKALTLIESRRISNGNTNTNILCYNTDANNTVSGGVSIIKSKTDTHFAPNADNAVTCGRPLAKWSDVQTYKVNALEPSSLSLPSGNVSDVIDISSYITDFSGTANTYTAPANGWVTISINNCTGIQAYIAGFLGDSRTRQTAGTIKFLMPICKNQTINLQVYGGSIDNARFIPCQGNV